MKGQILDYSIQTNSGVISGDDQNRYQFSGVQWRDPRNPARGQRVDFAVDGTGQAIEIYLTNQSIQLPNQLGNKNRIVAALLAFFLGGFGAHKFYLGQIGCLFCSSCESFFTYLYYCTCNKTTFC